jgi:hypothetical protein
MLAHAGGAELTSARTGRVCPPNAPRDDLYATPNARTSAVEHTFETGPAPLAAPRSVEGCPD